MQGKNKYKQIGQLIDKSEFFPDINNSNFELLSIKKAWIELTGDLGRKSEPIEIQFGSLLVIAEHTVYLNELRLLENEIIKLIKKSTGIDIKRINAKKAKIDWENKFNPEKTDQKQIPVENQDLIDKILKLP